MSRSLRLEKHDFSLTIKRRGGFNDAMEKPETQPPNASPSPSRWEDGFVVEHLLPSATLLVTGTNKSPNRQEQTPAADSQKVSGLEPCLVKLTKKAGNQHPVL